MALENLRPLKPSNYIHSINLAKLMLLCKKWWKSLGISWLPAMAQNPTIQWLNIVKAVGNKDWHVEIFGTKALFFTANHRGFLTECSDCPSLTISLECRLSNRSTWFRPVTVRIWGWPHQPSNSSTSTSRGSQCSSWIYLKNNQIGMSVSISL